MKWLYRIGLIIAGCYFESAMRNVVQMVLYWMQKPELLQGFLPYIVPVFMGYVYALEAREHWSDNRLKNDVMAYMGSTILIGYPLFISITLWLAGMEIDPTTSVIRTIATATLVANVAIATLVWRKALLGGRPFSLPWGTESGSAGVDVEGDGDEGASSSEEVIEGLVDEDQQAPEAGEVTEAGADDEINADRDTKAASDAAKKFSQGEVPEKKPE